MTQDEHALLEEEIKAVNKAGDILTQSYEKCQAFGIKESYSIDEQESIEAFTSRFARTADILTQRMFRLIDELDLDNEGTVRDRINRAEKKELIEQADDFVEIRKLRNSIAHEYQPNAPEKIYADVLKSTPNLFDSIERINRYIMKYNEG
jgi:uncharacterized protein YutE (UPF0331/DUF86 family)